MRLENLVTKADKDRLKHILRDLQGNYSSAMEPIFIDKIKRMFTVMMNDAGKLDILNRQLRTWQFSVPHEASEARRKRPNFMFFEAPAWVYLVCEIFGVHFMNCWRHWPEFLKPLQKHILVKWVAVDWDKTKETSGTFDTWKPGC